MVWQGEPEMGVACWGTYDGTLGASPSAVGSSPYCFCPEAEDIGRWG